MDGAGGGTGLPAFAETIVHFPVRSSFFDGASFKRFLIVTRIEFFESFWSLSFFLALSLDALLESESSESLDEDVVDPRFRFLTRFRFFLSLRPSRLFFFFFAFFSSLRLSLSIAGLSFLSDASAAFLRASNHFSSNFGSFSMNFCGQFSN